MALGVRMTGKDGQSQSLLSTKESSRNSTVIRKVVSLSGTQSSIPPARGAAGTKGILTSAIFSTALPFMSNVGE